MINDSGIDQRAFVRRLWRCVKPYRWRFALALGCMLLYGSLDGSLPFLVKYSIDWLVANPVSITLYLVAGLMISFAALRATAEFGQIYLMGWVSSQIVTDLRNSLQEKLLSLPPDYFFERTAADFISHVASDVVHVSRLLGESLVALLRDVIRISVLLAVLFYLDGFLAMFATVFFSLSVIPAYLLSLKARSLARDAGEHTAKLRMRTQENIYGARVIKSFNREMFELERFHRQSERLKDALVATELKRALASPIGEVTTSLVLAGIFVYGGSSVLDGSRSHGELVAFLLALVLLYQPYKRISRLQVAMQRGLVSARAIFKTLDEDRGFKPVEATGLPPDGYSVEFENVSFSYNGAKRSVSNVTLKIEEGTKAAIVGRSGSGKSTLVALLCRFIEAQEGRLKIGGKDINDLSLEALRSRISLVTQQTFLFNDTIFNNIAYAVHSPEEGAVIEAAKRAGAYDFISALPHGFSTMLGEGGLNLSGGERQRIAIARAFLKDAPILILDEATASLDYSVEKEVQKALAVLGKGKTTIIIAHRLSSVSQADFIAVMRNGEIVEAGRPDELLELRGEYFNLYSHQSAAHLNEAGSEELCLRL